MPLNGITQNIESKKGLIIFAVCLLTINSWVYAADTTDETEGPRQVQSTKYQQPEQLETAQGTEAVPEISDPNSKNDCIKSSDNSEVSVRELEDELNNASHAAKDRKAVNHKMDSGQ